jgi:hypothetical protein
MKKLLLIGALLSAVFARADIIVNTQTSTTLDVNFVLKDRFQLFGDTTATDTLLLSTFPGTSMTFYFRDGVIFFGGDEETFATNPPSGAFHYTQDNGALNFSGQYFVNPSTTVSWQINSWVSTVILGNDTWSGHLTATASSSRVPDGGATLALLGLGMLGIAALRKKLA